MRLRDGIAEFLVSLSAERGLAANTVAAYRRDLAQYAEFLGVTEEDDPSPATLLRPGNLALGVVANDAEAAAEALSKFWSVESADS